MHGRRGKGMANDLKGGRQYAKLFHLNGWNLEAYRFIIDAFCTRIAKSLKLRSDRTAWPNNRRSTSATCAEQPSGRRTLSPNTGQSMTARQRSKISNREPRSPHRTHPCPVNRPVRVRCSHIDRGPTLAEQTSRSPFSIFYGLSLGFSGHYVAVREQFYWMDAHHQISVRPIPSMVKS
jgi:hypothetical protein